MRPIGYIVLSIGGLSIGLNLSAIVFAGEPVAELLRNLAWLALAVQFGLVGIGQLLIVRMDRQFRHESAAGMAELEQHSRNAVHMWVAIAKAPWMRCKRCGTATAERRVIAALWCAFCEKRLTVGEVEVGDGPVPA